MGKTTTGQIKQNVARVDVYEKGIAGEKMKLPHAVCTIRRIWERQNVIVSSNTGLPKIHIECAASSSCWFVICTFPHQTCHCSSVKKFKLFQNAFFPIRTSLAKLKFLNTLIVRKVSWTWICGSASEGYHTVELRFAMSTSVFAVESCRKGVVKINLKCAISELRTTPAEPTNRQTTNHQPTEPKVKNHTNKQNW